MTAEKKSELKKELHDMSIVFDGFQTFGKEFNFILRRNLCDLFLTKTNKGEKLDVSEEDGLTLLRNVYQKLSCFPYGNELREKLLTKFPYVD